MEELKQFEESKQRPVKLFIFDFDDTIVIHSIKLKMEALFETFQEDFIARDITPENLFERFCELVGQYQGTKNENELCSEVLKSYFGESSKRIYKSFLKKFNDTYFQKLADRGIPKETEETLNILQSKNIPIFILSNGSMSYLAEITKNIKVKNGSATLSSYFSIIQARDNCLAKNQEGEFEYQLESDFDDFPSKPDGKAIENAIEIHNIFNPQNIINLPDRMFLIGDSKNYDLACVSSYNEMGGGFSKNAVQYDCNFIMTPFGEFDSPECEQQDIKIARNPEELKTIVQNILLQSLLQEPHINQKLLQSRTPSPIPRECCQSPFSECTSDEEEGNLHSIESFLSRGIVDLLNSDKENLQPEAAETETQSHNSL